MDGGSSSCRDEKQNIYGRDLEVDRRIKTNIPAGWNELTASFRLSDRSSGWRVVDVVARVML